MLRELISRNPDIQRLVDDGYEVEVRAGHLVLRRIPYVSSRCEVRYGELVTPITINGHEVGPPQDHTVYFRGEYPCDETGDQIEAIRNSSNRIELADDLWVDHYFSAKPYGRNYRDFHDKMTHYAQILGRYARKIDPGATARSGLLTLAEDPNDPFVYMETASSRSGITKMNEMLAKDKIGIVGLGGTGSYIMDYVSKTRVAEIHLFDGDQFQQHNAFRAPGASTTEEISDKRNKAEFYAMKYSVMRKGIVSHPKHIQPNDIDKLVCLDFVFVSIDDNSTKQWLLPLLEEKEVPFIDVGMGVEKADEKLLGIIRTSLSTPTNGFYGPQKKKICADLGQHGVGEYERNVQIVELNALNAALAVIKWKKWRGFYLDLEGEIQSTYTLDGNHLVNSGQRAIASIS